MPKGANAERRKCQSTEMPNDANARRRRTAENGEERRLTTEDGGARRSTARAQPTGPLLVICAVHAVCHLRSSSFAPLVSCAVRHLRPLSPPLALAPFPPRPIRVGFLSRSP